MKYQAVIFFMFSLLISTNRDLTAQTNKDESEIKALFERQQKAWNEGDIPAFMETYWKSPKLQFIGSSGPVYGWQNTLERYNKKYPDRQSMGQLQFDLTQIDKRSKDVFSVIGKYHLTRTGLEDLEGYFLIILKKFKNTGWVIVADSTH